VSDVVALILMVGITAYALFGGADFGAGFWDLTAGGAERGRHPRAVISHSIGPVWEANHVWLIFCLVVLWTGFSEAFALIVMGWGVAQWPYMFPETLKVSQATAPEATLVTILVVFIVAAIVILPSLGLAVRARPEEPVRARARRQRLERCGADPLGLS